MVTDTTIQDTDTNGKLFFLNKKKQDSNMRAYINILFNFINNSIKNVHCLGLTRRRKVL